MRRDKGYLTVAAAALGALVHAQPAAATTWVMPTSEVPNDTSVNRLSVTSTDGKNVLLVAGFSAGVMGTSALARAHINAYPGGLGVRELEGEPEGTGSPQHSTDSNGPDEILAFYFDAPTWDPLEVHFGWEHNDSDFRFLVGGTFSGMSGTPEDPFAGFAGKTIDQIMTMGTWYLRSHVHAVNTDPYHLLPNDGSETGQYLLVIAGGGQVPSDDYFKLSKLKAQFHAPPPPPPPPPPDVPEPSTLALAALCAGAGTVRGVQSRRSAG